MKLEKDDYMLDLNKRAASNKERESLYSRSYLGEIIEKDGIEFDSNNLIMAPVGSGKSYLIEKMLIPEGFSGKVIYLTSNSALKDSISPNNNDTRKRFAKEGKSVKFFTSENKKRFGNKQYSVHVMTYHEFGMRILSPTEKFTKDVDLVFCDEIHSVPIFSNYGGSNGELLVALKWLFEVHEDKTIYYFTATSESLEKLEKQMPGYMDNVKVFNYLNHPDIRRYEARSTYYISHLTQLRMHLSAKLSFVKGRGEKGLAFTQRIDDQERIAKIAKDEGYTPIVLWSINNDDKEMSEEQLSVRKYILETGNIPEPYNLLIINGAMQEGWNLVDNKVEFVILDTTDSTQQTQALGRVRKDVDFIIVKTTDRDLMAKSVVLESIYLDNPLTSVDKDLLVDKLDLRNSNGRQLRWPSIKSILQERGYIIKEGSVMIAGKKTRVSTITELHESFQD